MQTFDLSQLRWTLRGCHPWHWNRALTTETSAHLVPQVGPVEVAVPGSVHKSLLDAGVIPDWNVGANSLAAEWVEHRHWSFECDLPADWCSRAGRKVLRCEGLDAIGQVYCAGRFIGEFDNAFVPHEFDLSDAIAHADPSRPVQLAIVFTDQPKYLGQVNYTSRIRELKPRFYYIWDWVVRLVQVGIWDALTLRVGDAAIDQARCWTEFDFAQSRGAVHAAITVAHAPTGAVLRAQLVDAGRVIAAVERSAQAATQELSIEAASLRPWWPAGLGDQPLYELRITLLDAAGAVLDATTRRVGFRQVEWKPCHNSPDRAEPWLLHVNGRAVFMLGANWVPIRPNFADVTVDQYRRFIDAYRDHGFNLLRVWGGAVLEREAFYDLCDQAGILVWQEMPFSSSGIDNYPPDTPEMVAAGRRIAESYVARRQHHASLLMWCGGNELQKKNDVPGMGGVPEDLDHPLLGAMGQVCRRLDPTRKYVATSSTGPRFMAEEKEFGLGLHHDVHGPWKVHGTMADWRRYWDGDDALLRSETGVPGAQSVELMRRSLGEHALPGHLGNPLWRHSASWWTQWDEYFAEGGRDNDLEHYVAWSQQKQADALAYAVAACRRRFPRCGGFIVWMGHDCFPCPVNTSIFDFNADPKPAAVAIRDAMRQFDDPRGAP